MLSLLKSYVYHHAYNDQGDLLIKFSGNYDLSRMLKVFSTFSKIAERIHNGCRKNAQCDAAISSLVWLSAHYSNRVSK